MKYVMINPGKLNGKVNIPSSKSVCHRAIICAGLSEGVSNIYNVLFSQDVEATCSAMRNLGVKLKCSEDSIKINGTDLYNMNDTIINCFESGSTLRFLIPIAALAGKQITFEGSGKLIERPLQPYYDIFDHQQIYYKNVCGKLPLNINGRLKPGEYRIKGNISSQFISGLMFVLPLLNGDSVIKVTTELESKPYVDITMDVLKKFSIDIDNVNYSEFYIKGNQKYEAEDYKVEGDFSQAAFWLVAGTLGEMITCNNLTMNSFQGDKVILKIIEDMGGKVLIDNGNLEAVPSKTHGTIIDASQCPDLVPVLAVLAALSSGKTEIINAARLRFKESDRLNAISSELKRIGADIEEKEDGLVIIGKEYLKGGVVHSWNDHRIAMAMAVASIKCSEPVIIKDAQCVKKSYPDFWKHFRMLGGNIDEWSMGK